MRIDQPQHERLKRIFDRCTLSVPHRHRVHITVPRERAAKRVGCRVKHITVCLGSAAELTYELGERCVLAFLDVQLR